VFLLPWLAWYGRRALGWRGQAAALLGGLATLAIVHHLVDRAAGAAPTETVTNAFAHLQNVAYSLRRMASLKGVAELLNIFGLFTLPVLGALLWPAGRQVLAPVLGRAEATLFVVVVIHMLLSGDVGRMGYLAAPIAVAALALAGQAWGKTYTKDQ